MHALRTDDRTTCRKCETRTTPSPTTTATVTATPAPTGTAKAYRPTISGHESAEVVSALQKCIRRGQVDQALHWAVELDRSGYGAWCWKRLRIICSEDVGPAWPEGPATIDALYRTWLDLRKKADDKQAPWRLQLVHAVYLLASAPKSRVVDWALITHYAADAPKRDIPDVALDKHTARGKRLKRGWSHFFDAGTVLSPHAPQDLEADYRERARLLLE
jgi:replication-associated recombination protein RarA